MHFGGGEDEAGAHRDTSSDADADPQDWMHIYCIIDDRHMNMISPQRIEIAKGGTTVEQ